MPEVAPVLLPVVLGVFLLFVFVIGIYLFIRRNVSHRNAVLLCGLSDSGKTLLFTQLAYEQGVDTHSSLKENVHSCTFGKNAVKLIDIPGQERLRFEILERFKHLPRALIYVIDSSTFTSQLRDVAEFLYILLSDDVLSKLSLPVLIACNKQDEVMTKSKKVIQSQLEKEFNSLRVTKSGSLESTDGSKDHHSFVLGKEGVDFEFGHLKGYNVQFVECSAKEQELESVQEWLAKYT